VKGIEQKGTTATNGYVYLESIVLSEGNPHARIGFDKRGGSSVRQVTQLVGDKFDLYQQSGGLEEYRDGYRIESIDGYARTIRLLNGTVLHEGEMIGRVNDIYVRRHQIRETILSHIQKERKLFKMGIDATETGSCFVMTKDRRKNNPNHVVGITFACRIACVIIKKREKMRKKKRLILSDDFFFVILHANEL
jgi:hypothetical protein